MDTEVQIYLAAAKILSGMNKMSEADQALAVDIAIKLYLTACKQVRKQLFGKDESNLT